VIPNGADLSYEISGSSSALGQAIEATGYNGRVVIGSWYGSNQVSLLSSEYCIDPTIAQSFPW
jgi:threonine dehydrogenase-like Zn-dependent dehydrogenase